MRIGLWSFAHMHAFSYLSVFGSRDDIEWVGITDEDPDRGARVGRERNVPFVENPDDLLDQIDAVVINSANVDHCAMALRAAEAGVPALVEKPIATTVADAKAMVEAFDRAGLTLGISFPCPFFPAFVALQRTVQAGDLGKVLAVKATNHGTMPGGFFIQLERSGGGAVIDHTVHVADLLRRLTGAEALEVYAEIGHGLYHQEWDDSGFLTINMSDGSFATLDSSWSRPKSFPTWGDVTLKVVGERGNADADLTSQHLEFYPADGSKPTWQGWGTDTNWLMADDFIRALRESRPPRSTGLDGLKALEMALAAYRSAETGKPVKIEDLY